LAQADHDDVSLAAEAEDEIFGERSVVVQGAMRAYKGLYALPMRMGRGSPALGGFLKWPETA